MAKVGKDSIIPKNVMHGSFDVEAVKKFYNFYDHVPVQDFSEAGQFDFSSCGSKGAAFAPSPKKKVSFAEKHKKAKAILDAANMRVLEEYSEENLHRLDLAQKLFDLTSEQYAKEQTERAEELQYAESIGQNGF